MKEEIRKQLLESLHVLDKFLDDDNNINQIDAAATIMAQCIKNGGKIIAFGNGGSMSDAMHFASELTGRYKANRKPIAALAISDPGYLSCVANDFGYENTFARFIEAHCKPEDVLLALSTSGMSGNVCNAIHYKNQAVISITGQGGGILKMRSDVNIQIPHSGYADKIQEITIMIIHVLVEQIEKRLSK